jgi:DNA-binding MarR family transcriptional regulator
VFDLSTPKPPTKSKKRQQLLETLIYQLGRELSTRTVLFHAAIAERMGLSQGDHKALDLISDAAKLAAPLTAGQLAQASGLTTGAITGLIDRLEKANLVRRAPDPQDRRKVVLEPTRARDDEMLTIFSSISNGMFEITKGYGDAELEIITDYTRRCIELTKLETRRLRELSVTSTEIT